MIPLTELKGVGEKRQEGFARLSVYCVEDLLAYLPVRYRDLTHVRFLHAVDVLAPALFRVRCLHTPTVRYPRKNFSIVTCEIEDISGRATAVWFNQPYLAQHIKKDTELFLYGSVEIKQGMRRLMNPTVEKEDERILAPVYRLPASCGISQPRMRELVKQAMAYSAAHEKEVFDEAFRKRHHLIERETAIRQVHFPPDEQALSAARRRLCMEELLKIRLYMALRRDDQKHTAGTVFEKGDEAVEAFLQRMPFALTDAQKRVWNEIRTDLSSGRAMNRLVQGDVGCGKTVLALMSMLLAAANGFQAALMAPTDILARQHYEQACALFGSDRVAFLSGTLSAQERKRQKERIAGGTASFVVGTHALIQKDVVYHNLQLVITDEQHRFGVAQRARLAAKGQAPHTLVMSATPIPRTLSLIVFGDLDLSVVDQLPAGRKKISTSLIPEKREADMLAYIHGELQKGKQAYFVAPVIEEDEDSPCVSAEGLWEKLSSGLFADTPVALLHGRMTGDEKQKIMDDFASGAVKALVSTTVIEVGIHVKNATVMVIYGADRFGLAQLHQLRGRVGRGDEKSYCFLLTQNTNADTLERLKLLCAESDGFALAQKDFELRGPGDYLGKRQSGIAEARFSYALSDSLLLKETETVLRNEILPERERFALLEQAAVKAFDDDLTDIAYN